MSDERKPLVVELPRGNYGSFGTTVRLRRGTRMTVLSQSEVRDLVELLLKLLGQKAVALP